MEDQPSRPAGLIEIAVEPKTKADQERLLAALLYLSEHDPTFGVSADPKAGQVIISGLSEQHLAAKIDALKRDYRVEAKVGAPQVAYRETITCPATIDYTHKRQTGGSGQFARVKIGFEPTARGSGFVFENAVRDGAVPAEFVPGAQKGVLAQKETGLVAGFPLIDMKATLLDGAYHDIDSSSLTFEIAARAALRQLAEKASPILLEPVMRVEVTAPIECLDSVSKDLQRRRGIVDDASDGRSETIAAIVPLANMFGYESDLHAFCGKEARFVMALNRYEPLPHWLHSPDDDPRFPPAASLRAPLLRLA